MGKKSKAEVKALKRTPGPVMRQNLMSMQSRLLDLQASYKARAQALGGGSSIPVECDPCRPVVEPYECGSGDQQTLEVNDGGNE